MWIKELKLFFMEFPPPPVFEKTNNLRACFGFAGDSRGRAESILAIFCSLTGSPFLPSAREIARTARSVLTGRIVVMRLVFIA